MDRFLQPGGIIVLIIGSQALLLGALYKIQNWSSPHIFGMELDVLFCGIILSLVGVALIVIGKRRTNDVLELDEKKVKPTERKSS